MKNCIVPSPISEASEKDEERPRKVLKMKNCKVTNQSY